MSEQELVWVRIIFKPECRQDPLDCQMSIDERKRFVNTFTSKPDSGGISLTINFKGKATMLGLRFGDILYII